MEESDEGKSLLVKRPRGKRPDKKREGRTLLSKCVIVHTGAEREACASDLRNPPEFAKRGMAAGHHAPADIIHYGRADLRGGVHSVGVCEGAEQWVAFGAVVSREGAACRIGVERGGAVADGHEAVPELLLTRRGERALHGRLDRGVGERLDGG